MKRIGGGNMIKIKLNYLLLKEMFFKYVPVGLLLVYLVGMSIFYVMSASHIPTQNGDNIEHIHSSFLVFQGEVPYKDFFQHHNPLLWYLFAPLVGFFSYNTTIAEVVCVVSFLFFLKSLVYVYKINVEFLSNKLWGGIAGVVIATPLYKLYAVDFRPDNYMIFCLFGGIYYYFLYLKEKKQSNLSWSFIWFFVSFLFAQKALFPLFIIACHILYSWYRKDILTQDFIRALVYPIIGFVLFFIYLYSYDMVELYYVSNYTFNLNLEKGFEFSRIVDIPIHIKIVMFFAWCGVLASLFSKNKYWLFFSVLFVSEFFQRRFYFSPYSYYYWLMFYLGTMCAIPMLCRLNNKWRLISFIILGGSGYFFYHSLMFHYELIMGKKGDYLPNYITQRINQCDYVFNGDGMMYNIFGKDPAYYWQLIGQLDVIGEETNIKPKPNINELILELKPKFIYGRSYMNKFSDENGRQKVVHYIDRDIVEKYYDKTNFGVLYQLKKEYDNRDCVKNEKTGKWEYLK